MQTSGAYHFLIRSFALLAISFGQQVAAETVRVDIEGLDDDELQAAEASIELKQYEDRDVSVAQIRRLYQQAPDEIATALRPFGYYNASVAADLRSENEEFHAVFTVTTGEAVRVTASQVRVLGPAADDEVVRNAVAEFKPAVGEQMDDALYERSKALVTATLRSRGYFDMELTTHRVEVTQSANSAAIDVAWQSGPRYRFGPTRFTESQFDKEFLQRYIPWQSGEPYTTDKLLELQQRLVDADYFSAVSVQPDLDNATDGVVPIEALVIPAKRTVYTAGAYVSTDSGPGGRVGVERRWLNDRGHKIGGDVEYSRRLQSYSTFYRIPRPGERNRSYNFAAGYRDEETASSRSRTARISASEMLDSWHGYLRTLGLQYLSGDFEIADEWRDSSLLFAEGTLTRKESDDLMFPTEGRSLMYVVRLASEALLADTNLAQIQAHAKWLRPINDRSRVILRGSLGAMVVDDFDALPPELRFFAGGDRSIRGFDYQQIGEKNAAGGVIGGKYLTVASAEYEYYFLPKWGAGIFVDAGDAYSTRFKTNVGAGIGLRWRSPVGMVRLDVAMPVKTQSEDKGVRIHIVIGPDL
jgi:translocation and assembly module TamA